MTSQPKNKSKTVKPKAKSAVTAEAEPWPTETLVDDGARPDRIETPPLAAAPPKPAAPPKIAADPWTLVVDVAPEGRTDAPPVVVEVAPAGGAAHAAAAADGMAALVAPGASGLYRERPPGRGELRLDVDGPTRLMVASGVVIGSLAARLNWIARVKPVTGTLNRWSGTVSYRDGAAALLPQTAVDVTVTTAAGIRQATARFSGGGAPVKTVVYGQGSASFHPVEFEFDVVEGTTAVTSIETAAHPNRPAGLPAETLTIEKVFQRAGFDVSVTATGPTVPLARAGADAVWTNVEMHDAMQVFWSRFANTAQWSFWVLFAAKHIDGHGLGGIMFDSIGSNQRQGTAIFNDSFIADAPAGDAAPAAWVRRMRFWTACHEMGHAFNLAHSWQKSLGTPWIPLADEPEVRSFMNYPFRVAGGQTAFFADFAYRFSQDELMFMRHAPERFVQMGNALWFDHHGFENAKTSPEPKYRLELRANRAEPVFDFLEPCTLELKLGNVSGEPQLVSDNVLADDHLMVILKKDRGEARQWLPYAQYCRKSTKVVLEPGAARYDSLFLAAGRNGWDVAEPGHYTVQVALHYDGEDIVSNPLRLKITPPRGYEDERIAQDLFTDDVGRVLAFDGSRVLAAANDVLRDAAEHLPDRAIARHALVALNRPLMREGKVLDIPVSRPVPMQSAAEMGGAIAVAKAKPDEARTGLETALLEAPDKAARTLGHIDYKQYVDRLTDELADQGDRKGAVQAQTALQETLKARKVLPTVLAQVEAKLASLTA
jgi:hypothetical protein